MKPKKRIQRLESKINCKIKSKVRKFTNLELKPLVRARDGYKCAFCKRDVRKVKCGDNLGGKSVHHIIPKELGGPDIPDNCITLCANCHELLDDILIKPPRHIIKLRGVIEGYRLALEDLQETKLIKKRKYWFCRLFKKLVWKLKTSRKPGVKQ